jgi:glycosyltransferase involved in cell wall biosynthesis
MASPLFSIVIPTYNRSDLVQDAVRSVLAQSFEDHEVVVSDNCSEDDTRAIVESFTDKRVRYVRTPRHTSIADSWEFARSQARGRLMMTLSDDDALVQGALARFDEEHRRHGADFLFCNLAEYRDRSFVGPDQNVVSCGPFSGSARTVTREEFLRPLFGIRAKFNMHPSAFIVSTDIAARIAARCGRFFASNGVEYFAWPLSAIHATAMVHIDAPLVILGRTFKSWGSTIVLTNPGKEHIDKMIADVEHRRDWVPLKNFTLTNLIAEGLLLSKKMFPEELAPYPFDEQEYLRRTVRELRGRQALGVDVAKELCEALTYAKKYPDLATELAAPPRQTLTGEQSPVRQLARTLRLNRVRNRVGALSRNRKIRRGDVKTGFLASGADFGFKDALGCAEFVARVTQ